LQQSAEGRWWASDLQWCGPAGVGLARNPTEYVEHFLLPLHQAFPRPELEIGSMDCEGNYCGALFYLTAEQAGPWLGQAATGKRVRMKFGMHARIDVSVGLIADAWLQLDVIEAFQQMGVDLLTRAKEQHARLGGDATSAQLAELNDEVSAIKQDVTTDAVALPMLLGLLALAALSLLLRAHFVVRRSPLVQAPLLA